MNRREILSILGSVSICSIAGCASSATGDTTDTPPDVPSEISVGTRELEYRFYTDTPYLQYFHDESEELRAVCPDNDRFIIPRITAWTIRDDESDPMPRISEFTLDGTPPVDGFDGDAHWEDVDRRADGEPVTIHVPGSMTGDMSRIWPGVGRTISPVYDISGAVDTAIVEWQNDYELAPDRGEGFHDEPVEPSC